MIFEAFDNYAISKQIVDILALIYLRTLLGRSFAKLSVHHLLTLIKAEYILRLLESRLDEHSRFTEALFPFGFTQPKREAVRENICLRS